MKKAFLTSVLALGILIITPTFAGENITNETYSVLLQEKYTEVTVENLPQTVLDAIAADFKDATISKAFATEDGTEYKIEITKADGTSEVTYCDAEGNWITKEK